MKKTSNTFKKIIAIFFIAVIFIAEGCFQTAFAAAKKPATAAEDPVVISNQQDAGSDFVVDSNTNTAPSSVSPTPASKSSGSLQPPKDIPGVFTFIKNLLLNYVISLLIGIAVVTFLVGVLGYVKAGDNEEKRTAGRDLMLYGIVCLFVMISVWGFVKLLTTSFFGKDAFVLPTALPEGAKVAPK